MYAPGTHPVPKNVFPFLMALLRAPVRAGLTSRRRPVAGRDRPPGSLARRTAVRSGERRGAAAEDARATEGTMASVELQDRGHRTLWRTCLNRRREIEREGKPGEVVRLARCDRGAGGSCAGQLDRRGGHRFRMAGLPGVGPKRAAAVDACRARPPTAGLRRPGRYKGTERRHQQHGGHRQHGNPRKLHQRRSNRNHEGYVMIRDSSKPCPWFSPDRPRGLHRPVDNRHKGFTCP